VALVFVIGVGFVLALSRRFMIPFTAALLLAVAINPLPTFLERRWSFPNWLAAVVSIFIVAVGMGGLATLAYFGLAEVVGALPEYVETINEIVGGARQRLAALLPESGELEVPELPGLDSDYGFEMMRTVLGSSMDIVSGAALMFLFLLFFVAQRDLFQSKLGIFLEHYGLSNDEAGEGLSAVSSEISRYLWLKTAISAVTGAAFGLAAWLGGTPFPLFWGFIAFSFNYAPSIGPIIASIVPIILTFLALDSLVWAIVVSSILATIQLVSGTVVEPKVVGDDLDLNVITVFLSLLFWGLVWGPMGMLLSAPLTAVIRLVLDSNPKTRHIAKLMAS